MLGTGSMKCSGLLRSALWNHGLFRRLPVPENICAHQLHVFGRPEYSVECVRLKKGLSTCPVLSSKSDAKKDADDEDLDKPIKFSTSKAATLKAQYTLGGDPFPDAPWYQPYVVLFSVGCFLLYFLYLREENDLDEEMEKPLWERIPGLEKQQLQLVLEYNRQHDIDTTLIENRLKEIEIEESKKNALKPVNVT